MDILIKKKKRYNEFGSEKSRVKLLHWYVNDGKNQNIDKIKLIERVYRKQLRTKSNKKYQKFEVVIANEDGDFMHNSDLVGVHEYPTMLGMAVLWRSEGRFVT